MLANMRAAARALQEAQRLIGHDARRQNRSRLGEGSVPKFHFEVRTDTHVMLTEGIELSNDAAARIETSCRIGELLRKHAGQIWVDQD
jgi:hypothetical protein